MRLDRYQRLALSEVASQLPDLGKVESLAVDGIVVRDLTHLDPPKSAQPAGKIAQLIDARATWLADTFEKAAKAATKQPDVTTFFGKVASVLRKLGERIADTSAYKAVKRLLERDPEAVTTVKQVDINLTNGIHTRVPVLVEDTERTLALQRTSLAAELVQSVPGMPVVSLVVPPVAGLAAILGAAFFYAAGDEPMGRSLRGMALKHASLFAANLAPFVGVALPAAAALQDARDIRELESAG